MGRRVSFRLGAALVLVVSVAGCGAGADRSDGSIYGECGFVTEPCCFDGRCHGGLLCENRVCVRGPSHLAREQSFPTAIAVDETNVYWMNQGTVAADFTDGSIMKRPLAGGSPITLASGQSQLEAIAVYAGRVYWSRYTRGEPTGVGADCGICTVPIDGGDVNPLVSWEYSAVGLAVDATGVYWASHLTPAMPAAIMKIGLEGGTPITLPSTGEGYAVALDASAVYWSSLWGSAAITMLPLAGGAPVQLAVGQGAKAMAVDATGLYWAAGDAVRRWPLPGGGGVETLADLSPSSHHGVAVDTHDVYWTDGLGVARVPKTGGAATVVASNQGLAWGIAVDATSVYWTDNTAGTVMKLDK